MGERVALVTGAGGEMGRLLLPALKSEGFDLVALDLNPLPEESRALCRESATLDIRETASVENLLRRNAVNWVFHLAAVLSSHAERDPAMAHRVNVEATLGLFRMCREKAPGLVRFLFPSSIAVYGLPSPEAKTEQGALKEWQWTNPAGIYGCNKLYCELVGSYLTRRGPADRSRGLDFRALRFPGLISAETLPTGGTTDFAPEMIHAAAQGRPYACFVEESSRLPFMTMPDAIRALLDLAFAEAASLSVRAYNIKGFSCTAGEIRAEILRHFPGAKITYDPVPAKQAIVDSWPADVDDGKARADWGFAPRHGMAEALGDYLVPALSRRYASTAADPQR